MSIVFNIQWRHLVMSGEHSYLNGIIYCCAFHFVEINE